MTTLILGGTGFVGRNVLEALRGAGICPLSVSRSEGTDLRKINAVIQMLRKHRPEVIVNCAAHVGSLNYVTEQASDVILDNTRMILNLYEAVAVECPTALVINPIGTVLSGNDGHIRRRPLVGWSSPSVGIFLCFDAENAVVRRRVLSNAARRPKRSLPGAEHVRPVRFRRIPTRRTR